jgi:hypothetical protein
VHLTQGFANDLLGQARTFTALAGDTQGRTHIAVAAATFIDRIADLVVSNTFAETDVHKLRLVAMDE